MQRLTDQSYRYSPKDLIAYLEGDFAAWCERHHAERSLRTGSTSSTDSGYSKGFEPDLRDRPPRAMRAAVRVISQAELRAEDWWGIPASLPRIDGACTLGAPFYEPWDTKLARTAKPYFLLQLCAYADMLETMQGRRPDQ